MTVWPLLLVIAAPITETKPKEDPAVKELEAMEGTWIVVSYTVNDKKASDSGYASPKELVIKDGKLHLYEGQPSPLKIDPTKKPKEIDVYYPGAMKVKSHSKGIYELDKDELRLSIPFNDDAARPKKLTSEWAHLFILQRKK
jgi:uncharacterized protein (TIGR03067 family)